MSVERAVAQHDMASADAGRLVTVRFKHLGGRAQRPLGLRPAAGAVLLPAGSPVLRSTRAGGVLGRDLDDVPRRG